MRRFWSVVSDCVLLIAITLMLPFVILLLGLPSLASSSSYRPHLQSRPDTAVNEVAGNGSSEREMSGARTR